MLKSGKDGMVVFEQFLLEVLRRDPNYAAAQPKELQLRKLIDRYTYILRRQSEIKGESEALEAEVEDKVCGKRKEREAVFNRIIKLNSTIHRLTALNERLANELKQVEANIQYHVDNSSSELSRGEGWAHKTDNGGEQPVFEGEGEFGETGRGGEGRGRFCGQRHQGAGGQVE